MVPRFIGRNDYEAVKKAGEGGHKEINRTNYSLLEVEEKMRQPIVQQQLKLIHFRNINPAFEDGAEMKFNIEGSKIWIQWQNGNAKASLKADLNDCTFTYH